MQVTFEQAHAYFEKRLGEYKLPAKDKIAVSCPFHGNDRTPSLEVNLAKGGIWKCHAGSCGKQGGLIHFERFMFGQTEGRDRTDDELWARIETITGPLRSPSAGRGDKLGPVVTTYRYTNADGKLIFEKRRHDPKTFTQRMPNDRNGWDWTLERIPVKPLYRMPDLRNATMVFLCEGEKDVERLREAMGGTAEVAPTVADKSGKVHPLAVTCNFDGAGKWRPEYAANFTSRHVCIFADNDAAGRDHAAAVAAALFPVVQSIRVVQLSGLPEKGDVSDYLDSHSVTDLVAEAFKAPTFRPATAAVVEQSKPFFAKPAEMVRNGIPQVEWLMPRVVHKGSRGIIVAAPKAGKSMIGLDLALALSTGQSWLGLTPLQPIRTAVVSREDSPALTLSRLSELAKARGLALSDIEHLHLNTFVQRSTFAIDKDEDLQQLCDAVKAEGIQFVLCDVLNRLHSGQAEENSNTEMTRLMAKFDHVKNVTGCDIAIIHHAPANSLPGLKRSRGASAIDGWWDWKISVDVDAEDDTRKHIHFGTKAAMAHHSLTVQFASHPLKGIQVLLLEEGEAQPGSQPQKGRVLGFDRQSAASGH